MVWIQENFNDGGGKAASENALDERCAT